MRDPQLGVLERRIPGLPDHPAIPAESLDQGVIVAAGKGQPASQPILVVQSVTEVISGTLDASLGAFPHLVAGFVSEGSEGQGEGEEGEEVLHGYSLTRSISVSIFTS
jgi:hypothetical protein